MVSNVDMRVGLVDRDVIVYTCPRESICSRLSPTVSVMPLIKPSGFPTTTDDLAMKSTIHSISTMPELEAVQMKVISSCGHDFNVVGEIIGFAVEFKTCDLIILQGPICIHCILSHC